MNPTPSQIAIVPRPLRSEDLPDVFALIRRCYTEYNLVFNPDDECEQHLKDPCAYFRSHGGEFWVVPDETGIVRATSALYLHDGPTPRLAELKSMYVDPLWRRRRGVGRFMAGVVMDAARAAGCREMELWSDTRFGAAHAMYESLGFVRFGVREINDSNNSREFGYRRGL